MISKYSNDVEANVGDGDAARGSLAFRCVINSPFKVVPMLRADHDRELPRAR